MFIELQGPAGNPVFINAKAVKMIEEGGVGVVKLWFSPERNGHGYTEVAGRVAEIAQAINGYSRV